jgi:TRAP-type mannitol/chloroaromatic compound transport system permease small subunit
MQKLLLTVDKVSTFVGKTFSWLIVSLTFLITYEIFSRYALDAPHAYAFDMMLQMYGTLFMMSGAYTLSKNGHVRGDVLYGFFPPRLQAGLDLTLYIVFFLPGVVALCAGAFLLVQGIVEMIRCGVCLKQGQWPSRVADVEEVDVEKLKEMVKVKDEDIAKLDQYVTARKGGAA